MDFCFKVHVHEKQIFIYVNFSFQIFKDIIKMTKMKKETILHGFFNFNFV